MSTRLLQTLVSHAANVLWGSTSMIALLRSLGGRLRRNPGDSTVVRAELVFGDGPGGSSAAMSMPCS